ncbi:MAG: DUF554 domain-containing protein [Chloroflexi bacterium]|jgi:uncharacterized membrane protein YqgA involved in biofilm formation|nr:DUF554 domain-containing protein [Anaerolineaceae bacterium]NMB89198.1 DUF554 domain-containing protein [Chloroflexota bacterium]
MTGTLINVAGIIIGGALGTILGNRLPERVRQTVVSVLGLFTLAYGLQLFLQTSNSLIVLGSLMVGVLLGEWWQVENGLKKLGEWLQRRLVRQGEAGAQSLFIKGFVTSSLVFAIGPVAILGSIQDGMTGDFSLLAVKSVLDAFAALAFSSSLGVGVIFSSLVILVYQGSISLLANQVQALVSDAMMTEMIAVGGVLLMAIAVGNLLELRPIRTGSFLPALLVAPILVALLGWLGVAIP